MSKICTKCKIEKEVSAFYSIKRSPDGLDYWCRACHIIANKERKNSHTPIEYFFREKFGDFPANKYEIEQIMPLFKQEKIKRKYEL